MRGGRERVESGENEGYRMREGGTVTSAHSDLAMIRSSQRLRSRA